MSVARIGAPLCYTVGAMRRRDILAALILTPATARARGGPRGTDPERSAWFARQVNLGGGSCCGLGDYHELEPGALHFDQATGLWSVHLGDSWVEVAPWKMRDPAGGRPPGANPFVWYSMDSTNGLPSYAVWCLDPNEQF